MNIYLKNRQRSTDIDLKKLEEELSRALIHLHRESAEVSVLFVNSRSMKVLNMRFRGVPRDTDVLSFPLMDRPPDQGPFLLGDIVVSVPTALRQSRELQITLHDEILRLLIHGLLHLIGYDHEISAGEKRKMEKKEKEILNALTKVA